MFNAYQHASQNFSLMKFNLEERLINFAVLILEITEKNFQKQEEVVIYRGSFVRSGTAPALYYGEAQS
jgi:hypothetical protein